MTDYSPGPEMNTKRVLTLLSAALLLVILFLLRTCRREPVSHDVPDKMYVRLTDYDSIFRVYGDSLYNWKLLAAIAYAESGYDTVLHYKGEDRPIGMMQLMPKTYRAMLGMSRDTLIYSNSLNVKAAALYIHHLDSLFAFINPTERLNFVLGSYNSGPAHVFDAMRLARRDGINRYLWSNIREILPTLANEEVYTDSLVTSGRFLGTETINYVDRVQRKYRQFMEADTLDGAVTGLP